MKYRICSLLLTILTFTTFAVAVPAAPEEKRAPLAPPPTQTPPPTTSPAPKPGTIAPQDVQLVGPTENLTTVANRLRLKSKSLTTVITVPPNLPLTQPVTINVWYSSPAGSDTPSRGELYNPLTGNRFVHHDPEGDGKPRQLRIDIMLSEPKPGGGLVRFNVPRQINLDPLYDVTISPMRFGLLTACDSTDIVGGRSEIHLNWYFPNNERYVNKVLNRTATTPPVWETINQFAWARAEVSASHNLHPPKYWFFDQDTLHPFNYDEPKPHYDLNLVPGKTQNSAHLRVNVRQETFSLRQAALNATGQQCQAHLQHTITYQLRQYPNL